MQYLLTQKEYNDLLKTKENGLSSVRNTIQDLCTKVADHMPITWKWGDQRPGPVKPWGCILSTEGEWYCDQCPVQKVCPYENKEWSK